MENDRERERKIEEEHGENECAEQRAEIQSYNYSTLSYHCVSWEAECSHGQFQFIFIEAIVSILVGRRRRHRDSEGEKGNGTEGSAQREETERCMKG